MDLNTELKNVQDIRSFAEFFITNIHATTNSVTDWSGLPSKVKHLNQCLKEKTLPVIITLQAYNGLEPFLEFTIKELKEHTNFISRNISSEIDRKTLNTSLNSILNLIYDSSYDCLLKYIGQKYIKIFQSCQKLLLHQKKQPESSIKNLLNRLIDFSLYPKQQNPNRRKSLNTFVANYLMVEKAESPFEEIALNWIKKRTEELQSEDQQFVCCQIIFEHKKTTLLGGQFNESSNQEFKDYRWPLENQSIKFHLTKTIVGYLNTKGGIIYVGLKEDKQKIIECKGIKLSPQQKIDFLYFLHDDIMKGVYPKEPDRKEDEDVQAIQPNKSTNYQMKIKEEFESTQPKSEYRINKFVHVDFFDIYDKRTFLNSREDGLILYIARIKIKIGDTRELYHVINGDKQIPQAFFRQDKSVKKKSLNEFYTNFYERMRNPPNNTGSERIEPHLNCRFNAKCNQW